MVPDQTASIDQTAPIIAVCSGSTLFASILNSLVMLGNYLQQTTSADDISFLFFLALKGLIYGPHSEKTCLLSVRQSESPQLQKIGRPLSEKTCLRGFPQSDRVGTGLKST